LKVTARASANVALIKYWGKRDSDRLLPVTDSISITLDGLSTTTTVQWNKSLSRDLIRYNGELLEQGNTLKRIVEHLERVRTRGQLSHFAQVETRNTFPSSAGLASSASGMMALTLAAARAAGLEAAIDPIDWKNLSSLARLGSGSACRSAYGGVVQWHAGTAPDGSDSYAQQLLRAEEWPELRVIVVITRVRPKEISSRTGMNHTMLTSPFYEVWPHIVRQDIADFMSYLPHRAFDAIGQIAERNALRMHATMLGADPPLIYWEPATVEILHTLVALRREGISCYGTMDAGPQVKVLCQASQVNELRDRLGHLNGVLDLITCSLGPGPEMCHEHLF